MLSVVIVVLLLKVVSRQMDLEGINQKMIQIMVLKPNMLMLVIIGLKIQIVRLYKVLMVFTLVGLIHLTPVSTSLTKITHKL